MLDKVRHTLAKKFRFAHPFYGGLRNLLALPKQLRDFREFRRLQQEQGKTPLLSLNDADFCANDDTAATAFDRHYLFHIGWAARKLREMNPTRHVDIGSSLYLMAAVSAFIPIDFYDYRPPQVDLPGLTCKFMDLLHLSFPAGSIPSLSCLHVIEHVGLGRYGDPLDPCGDKKAADELRRVLAPDGHLLVVVPVGKPRVCFNAHRVYSHAQVQELFTGLELVECSLITDSPDDSALITPASACQCDKQNFGCGCFHFRKGAA